MLILDQRDKFIEYINNLFRRNRYGIFCNTTEEEFYDLFKDRDKWLSNNSPIDPSPGNKWPVFIGPFPLFKDWTAWQQAYIYAESYDIEILYNSLKEKNIEMIHVGYISQSLEGNTAYLFNPDLTSLSIFIEDLNRWLKMKEPFIQLSLEGNRAYPPEGYYFGISEASKYFLEDGLGHLLEDGNSKLILTK